MGLHYLSSADAAKQVASEILSEGGSVKLIRADASDPKAMAAAVNEAAERLGGLNGLRWIILEDKMVQDELSWRITWSKICLFWRIKCHKIDYFGQ